MFRLLTVVFVGALVCGACSSVDVSTEGDVSSECVPSCVDRACGDDGCGGSCGDCPDDNPCATASCDPATGACVGTPLEGPCDDGNECTSDDLCVAGACVSGAVWCECEVDADCAPREDDDLCNGVLICDRSGDEPACVVDPDSVVICPALAGPCSSSACDGATGVCGEVFAPDGQSCDDGDVCNGVSTCQSGECADGEPLVCDDENEGTDDTCDPVAGCVFTPVPDGTPCDDGDACTSGDIFLAMVCQGTAIECDDGQCANGLEACDSDVGCYTSEEEPCPADEDLCTQEICDLELQACTSVPMACGDGDPCTTDACVDGACENLAIDGCGGCVASDGGEICADDLDNDGDGETDEDECDGPDVWSLNCDDGDACTQDSCACPPPLFWWQCAPEEHACTYAPTDCDDNDSCTDDSCNPVTGCVFTYNELCAGDPDGDGSIGSNDCAPYDPLIYPGAEELCNEVDDNCDGVVDEGCFIDETSCEAAAAAFTSAGCLFAPIVGNDSSTAAGGPLPWAVIAANANDSATDVSLYDPEGGLIETAVIEGGELHVFELDGETNMQWELAEESGVFQRVFLLQATRPIVAYQFQPYSSSQSATADATLLLPRHAWGNNYLVLTPKGSGPSWVTIVSLDDDVEVRIRMPSVMSGSTAAGGIIPSLGPSDVHLLQMHSGQTARIYASQSVDMSGMGIYSGNKDVAVFVGSPGTSLPGPSWVPYNDYLEEQLPPRTAWGTDVAAVKFRPITDEEDVYRVMADKNGTTVTVTGDVNATYELDEGEFAQFESAGAFHVSGSDAILVAHGMVSCKMSSGQASSDDWPGWYEAQNNCGGPPPGGPTSIPAEDMGDPAVSFLTPSAQFRNEYVFLTPYTYAWDMLTIVVPDWAWDTVLVDGLPLPAPTTVPGTEGLSFARFIVEDGAHHVESPMVGVGIEVYGYDCRLSYAYAGGLSLGAINEPPPPDDFVDP